MNAWLKSAVGTCLVGGALVCGWYAWRATVAIQMARTEMGRIAAELRAAGVELSALEQRTRDAKNDAELLRKALNSVQKAKVESPDTNRTAKSPPRTSLNILDLIRDDPKAELLYLESQRSEVATRYGPLFKQLGLSAVEIARFQENVINRDTQRMDLRSVQQRTGEQADTEALAKLHAAADEDYEAAQRAMLGEPGYATLRDYERTSSYRRLVSAVAGVAAVEGVPFSPAQADQLVQALADASASYRAGGVVNTRDTDWVSVDTRAQLILTPAQFEVFRTMDPGPSLGGLLQNRMYSVVERAKLKEKHAAASGSAK